MGALVAGIVQGWLKRYPLGQALALAFVIALAAVMVVAVIFGFFEDFPAKFTINPDFPESQRVELLGTFAGVWVLSFILIFFLSKDQREDYYSEIRAALIGRWTVSIRTLEKGHGIEPEDQIELKYPIEFGYVQETKKLKIILEQQNSRIFEAKTFVTTAVHLGSVEDGHFRFIFRVGAKQRLLSNYRNPLGIDEINMPILFDMTFLYSKKTISEFSGYWYDVNNIVYRVMYCNTEDAAARRAIEESIKTGSGNFSSRITISAKQV
jgi:hypothetical protein